MTGLAPNRPEKWSRLILGLIPIFVLIAILDALVWLITSDTYTAYLHPRFGLFLLIGSVILAGFIVALMLGRLSPPAGSSGEILSRAVVLLIPLLFLYTAFGQGMGGHAFSKKFVGNEQALPYVFTDDPPPEDDAENGKDALLTLLQINQQMVPLQGKRVLTEGFVYTDANMPADQLMLFRFAMICCAADTTPVWLFVNKEGLGTFEPESWVRVAGVLEIANLNGKTVPMIMADTITQIPSPPPGAQYLYF
jgi:putative membrane protein